MSEEKAVTQIVVFDGIQDQISKARSHVEGQTFDYEDPKQNREARSLVQQVRKIKPLLNAAHKEAKAEALRVGRTLDEMKRGYLAEIEEIIAVHDVPIKALEERKAKELAEKIEKIRVEEARKEQERVDKIESDRVENEAKAAKLQSQIDQLQIDKETLEQEKKDADEKAEIAEADRKERIRIDQFLKDKEESDRREAVRVEDERKKKEVADKIEAERVDQERIATQKELDESNAKQEEQRIENEKLQAALKINEDAEAKRVADEKAKADKDEAEAKRKSANKKLQKKLRDQTAEDICTYMGIDFDGSDANGIVEAVISGEIRNVAWVV